MAKKSESWSAIGRRKSSVARVKMDIGKGIFIVNKRPIDNYFGRDILKMMLKQDQNMKVSYYLEQNKDGTKKGITLKKSDFGKLKSIFQEISEKQHSLFFF